MFLFVFVQLGQQEISKNWSKAAKNSPAPPLFGQGAGPFSGDTGSDGSMVVFLSTQNGD